MVAGKKSRKASVMSCKHFCQQGRLLCPTPEACHLPEIEKDTGVDWKFVWINVALIAVCVGMIAWILLESKWN